MFSKSRLYAESYDPWSLHTVPGYSHVLHAVCGLHQYQSLIVPKLHLHEVSSNWHVNMFEVLRVTCGVHSVWILFVKALWRCTTIILPVVLYGCKTSPLTLREERRGCVITGCWREYLDRRGMKWRNLHNEELHDRVEEDDRGKARSMNGGEEEWV
jgi:hypothetical protein